MDQISDHERGISDRGVSSRRSEGSSQAQGADEQAATDEQLEQTRQKVLKLIRAGRQVNPYAADNLEHWLGGRGKKRTMPAAAFTREQFLADHLRNVHLPKFAAGAERRLRSGEFKVGGFGEMTWTDSVVAPEISPLWLALGGFTVESKVRISATEFPGDPTAALIRFNRWTVICRDVYNWDPGKMAFVPLFGNIEDSEMKTLEAAGLARSYPIESVPFDALTVLGAVEVSVPR